MSFLSSSLNSSALLQQKTEKLLKRLENGWKEIERLVKRGKGLEKMIEDGGDGLGRGMVLLAESRRKCEVISKKIIIELISILN
jgi:hypothetical protein